VALDARLQRKENHLEPHHHPTDHLEPEPCKGCEAYRKEIAELKETIVLLELIVDTEPKGEK